MKLVKQKHKDGCGVACFAMLADISYRRAMRILHPWRLPFTKANTNNKHFVATFVKLGWNWTCSTDGNVDITKINNKAMLVIANEDKTYHGVVWDPKTKTVLDPQDPQKPLEYYQKRLYQVVQFWN